MGVVGIDVDFVFLGVAGVFFGEPCLLVEGTEKEGRGVRSNSGRVRFLGVEGILFDLAAFFDEDFFGDGGGVRTGRRDA
jgi:hypothetical protein